MYAYVHMSAKDGKDIDRNVDAGNSFNGILNAAVASKNLSEEATIGVHNRV